MRSIYWVLIVILACACQNSADKKPDPGIDPNVRRIENPKQDKKSSGRRAMVSQIQYIMKTRKKEVFVGNKPAKTFPLSQTPEATIYYVIMTGNIKPHRHLEHDEIFFLLKGEGVFYVESADGGIQSHQISEGAIVHVPRGVAHAYLHLSGKSKESVGINIYAPAYLKNDTYLVNWPLTDKWPGEKKSERPKRASVRNN